MVYLYFVGSCGLVHDFLLRWVYLDWLFICTWIFNFHYIPPVFSLHIQLPFLTQINYFSWLFALLLLLLASSFIVNSYFSLRLCVCLVWTFSCIIYPVVTTLTVLLTVHFEIDTVMIPVLNIIFHQPNWFSRRILAVNFSFAVVQAFFDWR